MYLNIYLKRIAIILFAIINLLLFFPLINVYSGKIYYLILVFIICNSYIYYSFKFSDFFLDKTLSIFIWLGYFYKLSIISITKTILPEGSGAFRYQPEQFDNLLVFLITGISGFFFFSVLYKKFINNKFQKNIHDEDSEKKLTKFYKKNKKIFFFIFIILLICTNFINFKTGFYQKGLLPKTEVNLILGYFIKWMLIFGLTSITCLFIDYDYKSYKNISYGVIILFFLELLLSNLSLLSRSLIFSGSVILFSVYFNYERVIVKKKIINSLTFNILILFIIFFITIFPVNKIRQFESTDIIYVAEKEIEKLEIKKLKIVNNEDAKNISKSFKSTIKEKEELDNKEKEELDNKEKEELDKEKKLEEIVKELKEFGITSNLTLSENFKRFLFIIKYRFVGLDSLAAVTSYPNKNLDLLLAALKDKYNPNDYGFYEKIFIRPYEQKEKLDLGFVRTSERHYSVILPGIISFLSYPGSVLFLFFSCGIIYVICASIETLAQKFSYDCLIFSNFIGYVMGYRLIHFGYLPKQSYLLFGAILLTIFLIKLFSLYVLNKNR